MGPSLDGSRGRSCTDDAEAPDRWGMASAPICAHTNGTMTVESPDAAGDDLTSPLERTLLADRCPKGSAPVSALTRVPDAIAAYCSGYSLSGSGSSSGST